jgi:hypothetical protein
MTRLVERFEGTSNRSQCAVGGEPYSFFNVPFMELWRSMNQ